MTPAAQWNAAGEGPAVFAYADNYLIDPKFAVTLDAEPTTAIRQTEVTAAKTMTTLIAERMGVAPARFAVDTGYGSAEMLNWPAADGRMEPHIPVFDKSARNDGSPSHTDFTYNHTGDAYTCPAGKLLSTRGTRVNDGATLTRWASTDDRSACDVNQRCCSNTPARKVSRSIYEGACDMSL